MTVRIQPDGYTLGRMDPGDWPFLGDQSFLAAVPDYTEALAGKLANADADVAAALNAAQRAEAAAQAAASDGVELDAGGLVNCTVVGAWTRVPLPLVQYNDFTSAVVSGGALVVPATGRYLLTAGVRVASSTAARRQFLIRRLDAAGANPSELAQATATDAYHAVSMSRVVDLTAGQRVELAYNVPAAVGLSVPTYLSLHRYK